MLRSNRESSHEPVGDNRPPSARHDCLWVRVFGLSTTGFLAYPVAGLGQSNGFYYIAIIIFAAGYLYVIWRNTPVRHENRAPLAIAVTLACGVALLPVLQFNWLGGLCFFACVLLLLNCSRRRSLRVVVAILVFFCACTIPFPSTAQAEAFMVTLILVTSGVQIAMYRQLDMSLQLREARVELARLAIAEERLRIARDLHDILGQNLSAIALRAELAACLLKPEPGRALEEINEVADIARCTVSEVKAAVSGYRRVSLASEARAAAALLTASGVITTIDDPAGSIGQLTDECAAWVVREAATNVIRHARARHCQITLAREDGAVLVEVRDDGAGGRLLGPPLFGNGLGGLAERVSMAGGEVSVEPRDGWFVVRAHLPLGLSTASAADGRPAPQAVPG